ncbi:MAG: MotA/TolQ/ExbB proton channel family protein [Pseudomonadota bacterium]
MNKQLIKFCSSVMLLASVSVATLVQAQGTIEEVLENARATTAAQAALTEQRAAEFNAMSDADKQRATQQVAANRAAIQTQVDAKNQQYADNDLQLSQLNTQLRDKVGGLDMTQVFGLVRQYSTDYAGTFQQSLINAQFANEEDNRIEFLQEVGASERILTAAQLERFWFEMQREMTASGQVARYNGTVVEPNGTPITTDVVRIGPFLAIANGEYLSYIPELSRLNLLPRQPEPLLGDAAALQSATSGYVPAIFDTTRGVLMAMYVERPTLWERIEEGEVIVYVILIVGALGVLAFIYQLLYLIVARMGVSAQLRTLQSPKSNNALGRVLLAFKGDVTTLNENAEVAELRISESVMREVPKLERFQPFLRLVVAAGPLLGLVGTVMGMIVTFQSITESGSSDPKLMANGIGQAMIATLLGLGIAVPMLFANALLNSLSRSIVQILDEQSAGMLADNLEKRKHG